MNPQFEFEDIEDYLADRMSASDRLAFEQALESDPELVLRVEALKAETKVNRLLREAYLLEQFAEWDKEDSEKKIAVPNTPPYDGAKTLPMYRRWWMPLAAAASLVGIAVVGVTFGWIGTKSELHTFGSGPIINADTSELPKTPVRPHTNEERTAERPAPVENPAAPNLAPELIAALDETFIEQDFYQPLMGDKHENKEDNYYKKAAKLYDKGDYKNALKMLENPGQIKDVEYFYLRAYSYYQLGKYNNAERDFHAIRGFEDSDRMVDAVWCEVFCMAKQLPASRKRLDKTLQELIDKKGYYAKRALKLQGVLKKY